MNPPAAPRCPPRFTLLARDDDRGLGEAWRAVDAQLGREVTWKLLPPEAASLDALAVVARTPSLEGVARPLDGGTHEGSAWVTYAVEGASLGRILDDARARQELLPLPWIAAVFEAAARAIAALHAVGVVHGAVGPATVFVRAGAAPEVCLLDVGATGAVAVDAPRGSARATSCAAPEVLAGEPPSPSSDVYALGMLLLEALALPRWSGRATQTSLRYEGRLDVADAVWDAAILATRPRPAERFASVTAMRAALAREWGRAELAEAPEDEEPEVASRTVALAPAEAPRRRHGGTALAEDVGIDAGGGGAVFSGTMIADVDQRMARMQSLSSALLAHDFARNLPPVSQPPPPPMPAPPSTSMAPQMSLAPAPPPLAATPRAAPSPEASARTFLVISLAILALAGVAMIAWALTRGAR